VFNDAAPFWTTIPLLREDPRNIEDVDTRQEDHVYDSVRYGLMFRPIKPRVQPRHDTGSFQAERRKLIKAKQYAQRYGTDLSTAYGRVR
jgi:hypothetical protein